MTLTQSQLFSLLQWPHYARNEVLRVFHGVNPAGVTYMTSDEPIVQIKLRKPVINGTPIDGYADQYIRVFAAVMPDKLGFAIFVATENDKITWRYEDILET